MHTTNTLAEIITIGDEILIGQIIDTNSAWIGQQLNLIGIKVVQITSVPDNRAMILEALRNAEQRAKVILITGGLGPTKDDITKNTLCEFFKCELKIDENILNNITDLFKNVGREMTEVQIAQAAIPELAVAIRNMNGTAPGIWIEQENSVFISMPGVPYEMMGIMIDSVIPKLKTHFETPAIAHKTILTQGIGESILSEKISKWEEELPPHIRLAYLPSVGSVKLRISAFDKSLNILKNEIDEEIVKVMPIIDRFVYGFEDDTLEFVIGKLLKDSNQTLSIAESCTGGYLSHLITKIPGSSAYYKGSIVCYANEIKESFLGIDKHLIELFGAVSEEVVKQLATNIRIKFDTDFAIATSGIAGPDGGTDEKPVGTVWIAVANKTTVMATKYLFGTNRGRTIENTALTALMNLRKLILNGKKK